jgi:protocatechuate 3,4-dioxygenase beta subunit
VIAGTVVADNSGSPVRRVRLTLAGAELRGGRSTITDDQGQFSFTALPAGRYNLTASKAGYVDITYGAKRPGRPGTPIQLADGQKLEKANISLPRGSVITGLVVDEHGEPSTGTQVRVLRYAMRSGERTLQQVGQDQTDDRGIYRIFSLQPGEHVVYAMPRNQNISNLQQTVMAEIEALMQQAQAAGVDVGRGGRGGGRGGELGGMLAGGRGQPFLDRARELQDRLQQAEQEPQAAYAPVYYPGTATPSGASSVTIGVGEERGGIDFQLQLVPTARVEGMVSSADGTLPQGTQVSLVAADRGNMPSIPGIGGNQARVGADGRFSFTNITPGQYTLQARAVIRAVPTEAEVAAMAARGGRGRGGFEGGPGGRGGAITQVLWASSDVTVSGTNVQNVALSLQPGMTVSGQINFETGTGNRPTDMSNVRINITPRGQQGFEMGQAAPAQVDASGRFTITGVPPGRYTINANVPGARGGGPGVAAGGSGGRGGQAQPQPTTTATTQMQWYLKSAMIGGREALDFPFEVMPNGDVPGAMLTFSDKTQELSGVIQDALGQPTADFTIVVFPADNRYWVPQARRISAVRPGTDGRFTFRNLPPGEYRMTAITDAEPGEWFDPAFLNQLASASIAVSIAEGQRKVQDIRLAGGGF